MLSLNAVRSLRSLRALHTSRPTSFPRKRKEEIHNPHLPRFQATGLLLDGNDVDEEVDEDGQPVDLNEPSSAMHLYLEQQREKLKYMRLIEHEVPLLAQWREPFVPPSQEECVSVRAISYGGEEHPATVKRVIVVPVTRLPLSPSAMHAFKLIAGPRWTPRPPPDSGHTGDADEALHGYVKLSSENLPKPAMNLKWLSDTLDKMIATAHENKDKFAQIPHDTRHIESQSQKYRNKDRHPTIKDFPSDWLPQSNANVA